MPRSRASQKDLPETWKIPLGTGACWLDAAGSAASGIMRPEPGTRLRISRHLPDVHAGLAIDAIQSDR
jgi:hypothetical protein